jgi:type III secretion protein J
MDHRLYRNAHRFAVVLVGLLCLSLSGCGEATAEVTVVETEKEANRILVELANRDIKDAEKVAKTEQRKSVFVITVPKSELNRAREILVQLDLPREPRGGFQAMISQAGLIPTRTDERAKLMHAIASELERTLEVYDRVVTARVHIVLPEKDMLEREDGKKPTASAMVLIKYTPDPSVRGTPATGAPNEEPPDRPIPMEQVRTMVARSAEGLEANNVVVAYTPALTLKPVSPSATTRPADAATELKLKNAKDLALQLGAAAVVFGLAAILFVFLLVREKRKASRAGRPATA